MSSLRSPLLLTPLFFIMSLAPAEAGIKLTESIQSIDQDVGRIMRQLNDTQRQINAPLPSYQKLEEKARQSGAAEALEIQKIVEDVQREVEQRTGEVEESVMEVDSQLVALEARLRELQELGAEIDAEKAELEAERERIITEKEDVETREQLFSMGFYASLTTTFAAVAGLIFRIPTARLERRLKSLEIEHKELELVKLRKPETV